MRSITLEQFITQLKAQGVPRRHVAMKCPICHTIQSMDDLIRAGIGATEDDVEQYVGFSCVGRFTNAGPHQKNAPPGKGCNWTLGGLFHFHELEVVTPDGKKHMRFELATPEEAQAHLRSKS